MKIKVNNKEVNVPQETIKNFMKTLDLTEEEAIQMYLEDEGYLENEEVAELTKKAKENKTDKIVATRDKREKKKVDRKPTENPLKEQIISDLYQFLKEKYPEINIKIANKTKLLEFGLQNKEFKLDLVQKREKKA